MGSDYKTLVIIPVYNEEDSIDAVIARVKQGVPFADPVLGALRPWAEGPRVQDKCTVVINDGSTDATAAIAEGMDTFAIGLPYNLGIGAAMQTGYIFADERL